MKAKITLAGVITLVVFISTTTIGIGITPILLQQQAYGFIVLLPDAPIAASGHNVYVTWWTPEKREVMFRASNDDGKTFGDKINLSNTPASNSAHSDIAASGDNVYVSFHDNKTGNVDTYVKASKDRGKTFGPIIAINGTGTLPQKTRLVNVPGLDILKDAEENTMIAASGDNVYVVSWDKKNGNWEVFLARSTDNGDSFQDTVNLSNTSDKRSDRAWLVANGDNVYVSWWETAKDGKQEPIMRVSNDNGATFGSALKLAANGTIGSS